MDLKNFYAEEWARSSNSNLQNQSWLDKFFDPEKVEAILRGEKIGTEDKDVVALLFSDVVQPLINSFSYYENK